MLNPLRVEDVERIPLDAHAVEVDLARFGNGDVNALKNDFDGVILGVLP